MKLNELEPRWLTFEGRRVGFIFRCPTRTSQWQTCFIERFPLFTGTLPSVDDWCTPDSQFGIIDACCPDIDTKDVQPCNKECCWTIDGGIESAAFETLSVTPSLDGSAAGNWHGYITNGEIVGGM